MEYFLNFLSVPKNSSRYARDGLYASHLLTMCDHRSDTTRGSGKVRIVVLDTRSGRDQFVLPSIGGNTWIPFAAVIAAMFRWICAAFGIGSDYSGHMLGETQMQWLEAQLKESLRREESAVVLVSSVQILTSNPIVESWGHFPQDQRMLLDLLHEYKNAGGAVVLMSGDVHYAEIAHVDGLLEITSSGLTHTCLTLPLVRFFCPWMLGAFDGHRHPDVVIDSSKDEGSSSSAYAGLNFGVLHFSPDHIRASIRGVDGYEKLVAFETLSKSATGTSSSERIAGTTTIHTTATLFRLVQFLFLAACVAGGVIAALVAVFRRIRMQTQKGPKRL